MSTSNKRARTSGNLEEDSLCADLRDFSAIEFPIVDYVLDQTRSWCTDERKTLHDWVIEVVSEDDHTSKKYYVHKVFLGAGENCSEYFGRLFGTSGRVRELQESASKLVLPPSAAAAFPEMLDHIYTGKCSFTTESCLALTFLSKYFVIRTLYRDVQKFLEDDITESTAHIYLSEASLYQDQRIIDKATRIVAENFGKFEMDQLRIFDPELMHSVIDSEYLICESQDISSKVAEYIRCRPEDIDSAFFASVTNDKYMPEINPKEAFFFLNLSTKHGSDSNDIGMADKQLHSRCIATCKNWKTAFSNLLLVKTVDEHYQENEEYDDSYITLPDVVKIEALETAIRSAFDENEKLSSTVLELTTKNKNLREKGSLLSKKVISYAAKMKAINTELCKFRRLSSTDNLADYSILGSLEDVPTMMPKFQSFPSLTRNEGIVHCERQPFETENKKRWPIYYYQGDLYD